MGAETAVVGFDDAGMHATRNPSVDAETIDVWMYAKPGLENAEP